MENGKKVAKENVVLSLSHFPPTEVLKSHGKRKSCFVNTPVPSHGKRKSCFVNTPVPSHGKRKYCFVNIQSPPTEVLKSHGNDALKIHPNDISRKSSLGPPSFTHPKS